MEDYKKKYEDAFLKAEETYNDKDNIQYVNVEGMLEEIFPELKMSEDEKIRKEIIEFLQLPHRQFVGNRKQEKWIAWLEKQGEQNPSDKVETKFKVGDWIVYNDTNVYQVKEIDYTNIIPRYELENIDRDKLSMPFTSDYNLRNWTIEDAKDGDVVVTLPLNGSNQSRRIFIFKEITDGSHIKNAIDYYCQLFNNKFMVKSEFGYIGETIDDFAPANKEQRDLLFQKIIEAGYEWDAEKKELKKIDNKEVNGEDYGIDGLWHAKTILEKVLGEVEGYKSDDGILEHKCAIDVVKNLYEKNHTWNDDDEIGYNDSLWAIKQARTIAKNENDMGNLWYAERWLKSIKDRVQPHWKPTEEQMEALNVVCKCYYIVHILSNNDYEKIKSLYNDLKKL